MKGQILNFKISWKQTYPNWHSVVDANIETVLQYSDFKEANQVIERIKQL